MSRRLKRVGIIGGIVLALSITGCANSSVEEINSEHSEDETQLPENQTEQNQMTYLEPSVISQDAQYFGTNLTYVNYEAELIIAGQNHKIQFQWAKAGDSVVLKMEENLPSGVSVETISGNTDKVLLLLGEKQGYVKEVYLCDLSQKTMASLFTEDISKYSVYGVEMSSDLRHVVLNTDERDFYYNGSEMIDLAKVSAQENALRVSATMSADKVLISADDGANLTSFYVYDPQSNTAQQTVQLQTKINTDNRDKGFKRYGDAYATDFKDNKLVVWNLVTGKSCITDIGYADVKYILSIDEGSLLVITTEYKLCKVDKESAAIQLVSDKAVDFSNAKSWGIRVATDGTAYLSVQQGDETFAYYKL